MVKHVIVRTYSGGPLFDTFGPHIELISYIYIYTYLVPFTVVVCY